MAQNRLSPLHMAAIAALFLGACGGEAPEPGTTTNPDAQAAFEAANELWTSPTVTLAQREEAIAGLAHAVELDPEFGNAYAYLAESQAYVHQNWDRSPERAEQALAAAQRAVELDPTNPAAHRALGAYHYRIAKDYPAAIESYDRALELEPQDAATIRMTAYIARRAGRWEDAAARLEEADGIESGSAALLELATTYRNMGRYDDAEEAINRAAALDPDAIGPKSALAWHTFYRDGDISAVRDFLAGRTGGYVSNRWFVAMLDGDWQAALDALEAPGSDPLIGQYGITPRSMLAGLAYERMGDAAKAKAAWDQARQTMEGMVAERPDDPRTHLALGMALAGLGEKDRAIEEGQTGVDLMPTERDGMIGPHSVLGLAEICAVAGDAACTARELRSLMSAPMPWTSASLLKDPWLAEVVQHPAVVEALGG
jgi:tetratricopeptide (TPR) repeat protein